MMSCFLNPNFCTGDVRLEDDLGDGGADADLRPVCHRGGHRRVPRSLPRHQLRLNVRARNGKGPEMDERMKL